MSIAERDLGVHGGCGGGMSMGDNADVDGGDVGVWKRVGESVW